jgi:hypothetical protein
LASPDYPRRFELDGEQIYPDREWLRIKLKGEPYGVSYATPIHKNLMLILLMTVYGEEANESRLFAEREETLEQMLTTVRIKKTETGSQEID